MFTKATYIKISGAYELHLSTDVKRFYEPDGNCSFKMSGVPTEEFARQVLANLGLGELPFEVIDVS